MSHSIQTRTLLTAIAVSIAIAVTDAQRRVPGQAQSTQTIAVSLRVGGQPYESKDPGRCTHASTASIYSIVSEMWSVQQSSDGRSLALTLWRPKDGSGDMATLSVSGSGTSHQVNTVRGGGAVSGSGKVALQKSGSGGTFTIDAKTKDGAPITGTIQCDAFAPHIAEGGN